MAYIKVNVNSILSYSDSFDSVKNRTIEIRNQFVSLVNELEWDVKNSDCVYDSAKSIVSDLETECNSLNKMAAFATKTGQVYGLIDMTAVRVEAQSNIVATNSTKINAQQAIAKSSREDYYAENAPRIDLVEGLGGLSDLGLLDFDMPGYLSSIFGYNTLIMEQWNNSVDWYFDSEYFKNRLGLSEEEREYMLGAVDTLTKIDASLDAISWSVGCVFPFTKIDEFITKPLDALSEGINSFEVQMELLEFKRETDTAKKELQNADGLFETVGAAINVGWEYVEGAFEVAGTAIGSAAVKFVETAVVEPVKKVWSGVKNLFKGW